MTPNCVTPNCVAPKLESVGGYSLYCLEEEFSETELPVYGILEN
jgi:hypothetical protein